MSLEWNRSELGQSNAMARRIMEKSLQMRCFAYLSGVKSELLRATLLELEGSKRRVIERSDVVKAQKRELELLRQGLEERVAARTRELRLSNEQLRHEIEENRLGQLKLKRANDRFVQAQKMEMVGQLAGGVAHDFNNYLSVIMGGIELAILRAEGGSVPVESLSQIRESVDGAAAVARQLLLFSQRRSFLQASVNLHTMMSRLKAVFTRLLGEDIVFELVARGAPSVWVDERYLEQVIVNLLLNAKHAIGSSGRVRLWTQLHSIEEDREGGPPAGAYVRLSVTDTGCGMSDEVKAHAKEGFFTTKSEGSGLGLMMVNEVMTRMGGAVKIDSVLGEGTTVHLYLPMADQPAEASVSAERALQRGAERILVIDDDPSVRSVLKELLEFLGYTVFTLASAVLVFDWLKGQSVDLVISDVRLPKMSGIELKRRLASRHPQQKVLLMSGSIGDRVRSESLVFLSKPLTIQDVSAVIRVSLNTSSP